VSDPLFIDIELYGENAMAEQDLCIAVGEDLTRSYPGYDWYVGVILEAGSIAIDLLCGKPPQYRNHGYLLHIPSLLGPGGHERVMRAGGELLERFGLPRTSAPHDWRQRAVENGLDVTGEVKKSRNGG
jgi:hypothetical protein